VLNAFNAGGAQIGGSRTVHQTDIADDLDISVGRHALRTGFLIEAGQFRTDIRRNAAGTFTFASLDAFTAGMPTTFARNVGDPLVSVSAVQAGLYFQDDFRVRKDLTVSGGVRQEYSRRSAGFTSARAAASPGRRSRAARRRCGAARASSSTGSTPRATSRQCSSTVHISRLKRSSSRDIRSPLPAAARSRCPRAASSCRPRSRNRC
jgi:outer membrane receptor protein involved in Fe transport